MLYLQSLQRILLYDVKTPKFCVAVLTWARSSVLQLFSNCIQFIKITIQFVVFFFGFIFLLSMKSGANNDKQVGIENCFPFRMNTEM